MKWGGDLEKSVFVRRSAMTPKDYFEMEKRWDLELWASLPPVRILKF